jgi:hypothetical protein
MERKRRLKNVNDKFLKRGKYKGFAHFPTCHSRAGGNPSSSSFLFHISGFVLTLFRN